MKAMSLGLIASGVLGQTEVDYNPWNPNTVISKGTSAGKPDWKTYTLTDSVQMDNYEWKMDTLTVYDVDTGMSWL